MTETIPVQVICPNCRSEFEVPDGTPEAQCAQCAENIVWRRCLDTDEVFAVLTSWSTWVHPGCDSQHQVDLTVVLPAPADDGAAPVDSVDGAAAAPIALAEYADWTDQRMTGRLSIDDSCLAMWSAGPAAAPTPITVAWLVDIVDYAVSASDAAAEDPLAKKPRGLRRSSKKAAEPATNAAWAKLTVTGRETQATIMCAVDAAVLQAQLDNFLRPRLTRVEA